MGFKDQTKRYGSLIGQAAPRQVRGKKQIIGKNWKSYFCGWCLIVEKDQSSFLRCKEKNGCGQIKIYRGIKEWQCL